MAALIEALLGLGICGLIFGIPLMAIWTAHKQKMKQMEIASKAGQLEPSSELESLKNELFALRERVNEQALDVERMKDWARLSQSDDRPISGEIEEQRLNS